MFDKIVNKPLYNFWKNSLISDIYKLFSVILSLNKKWISYKKISVVNVNKSVKNPRFTHIY